VVIRRNDTLALRKTTMEHSKNSRLRKWLNSSKRFFKREPDVPEDPYAYVTAPKKPRPTYRSAAAVADRPED
jgi:hypothetical protein